MVLSATGYWTLVCHSSFIPQSIGLERLSKLLRRASLRTLEPDLDHVQMMQHDACMTMMHMMTLYIQHCKGYEEQLKGKLLRVA
jgi:hypothetical protein